MLEALNIKNGDGKPEFEGLEGPCDAEIPACCFLRSFFLLARRFSVASSLCFCLLPPRGIAKKTVGTSVHHGGMLRHAIYTAKVCHYIQTNAAAANAHLEAAHRFLVAGSNRIKITGEFLVHALVSLGSYE